MNIQSHYFLGHESNILALLFVIRFSLRYINTLDNICTIWFISIDRLVCPRHSHRIIHPILPAMLEVVFKLNRILTLYGYFISYFLTRFTITNYRFEAITLIYVTCLSTIESNRWRMLSYIYCFFKIYRFTVALIYTPFICDRITTIRI